MRDHRAKSIGLPGSFLIAQEEKRGHILRRVFYAGIILAIAFPAAGFWGAFTMDVGPRQPGDTLHGIEKFVPVAAGILLNPGFVMIAGALTRNTFHVSRYLADSEPGEFSPELWQSCGRWRGWFCPGLDLLRNNSRTHGIVALGQWIHVGLGWFFAIPLLPVMAFFMDPLTGSNSTVFILLIVLLVTIPFGVFSARATGHLWRRLSTAK